MLAAVQFKAAAFTANSYRDSHNAEALQMQAANGQETS
jgi:hypothetical protein